MKKIILFAAILFAGFSVVKAEGPVQAETKLTVTLNPIQTITINQSSVDLLYDTDVKYKSGVTSTNADHFKIYSTGGFSVSVNSATDFLTGKENSEKTIEASTITVKAEKGTNTSNLTLTGNTAIPLSKTAKPLFTSDKGGIDLAFNVDYVGAGTEIYFDKLFNASTASVFETTVTYSIVPN